MNNFKDLGLSPSLLEVLEQLEFKQPTPVQEQSIPQLLSKDPTDFIGLAQTGTGKTAAFGLPLLDLIHADLSKIQALIMAPTRELAQQTAKQLTDFSRNNSAIKIEVVYGGAAITNQIKALKRPPTILVATPGRLLDLIKRKALQLETVKYVVLDEADEMLNMGFKEDIDKILSFTSNERVTWLFSATMPPEIRKIINKYMRDPIEVSINAEEKSNKDISHQYVVTKTANKLVALRRFLDIQPEMRGIMFCRTKRETQQIADDLASLGYGVEALHGDLNQSQREKVMKRFKTRAMQLLIATDVAARGIDVNDLTHVIHHTLPDQLESYTHRSGRTGRAGKKGISIVFINPREGRKITDLERKIKVKFELVKIPTLDSLRSSRVNHWAHLITNTQVDQQAETILSELSDHFAHFSKEDILKRMITLQLDHLTSDKDEMSELDESIDSGGGASKSSSSMSRFYINIGSIDGLTKGDLIHFISDIAGIDRKLFGSLDLNKNHSYFEVDKANEKGLAEKFKGIEIEGRSIRVNRDGDGRSAPKASKGRDRRRDNMPKQHFRNKRKKRSKR